MRSRQLGIHTQTLYMRIVGYICNNIFRINFYYPINFYKMPLMRRFSPNRVVILVVTCSRERLILAHTCPSGTRITYIQTVLVCIVRTLARMGQVSTLQRGSLSGSFSLRLVGRSPQRRSSARRQINAQTIQLLPSRLVVAQLFITAQTIQLLPP